MHTGQFVTVIMPEEKYVIQAEKLGFTDHAKYSNPGYLVAGDDGYLVAGDSDPPWFILVAGEPSIRGSGDDPPGYSL